LTHSGNLQLAELAGLKRHYRGTDLLGGLANLLKIVRRQLENRDPSACQIC